MERSIQRTYDRIPATGAARRGANDPPRSESPVGFAARGDGASGIDPPEDDALADDGIRDSGVLRAEYLEVENGIEEEPPADRSGRRYSRSAVERVLTANLVGDKRLLHLYRRACRAGDDPDVDDGGLAMVKLVKLWAFSLSGIVFMHQFARRVNWEVDENYTLRDFIQYDFAAVLLDLLFFFAVGRLHDASCRGVDRLFPWGAFAASGAVYPSVANYFKFLRHSISMYDIMCSWPFILFVYAFALAALGTAFCVALVRSHHRRNVLRSRIAEAAALLCLFGLPCLKSEAFHLHHWFGMWWVGMQSNAPEWWARAFQAYALGAYVNGIAVYGRDPVLGCQYSFYLSKNMACDYIKCYEVPKNETSGTSGGKAYKDFVAPDWRICNAGELNTYP